MNRFFATVLLFVGTISIAHGAPMQVTATGKVQIEYGYSGSYSFKKPAKLTIDLRTKNTVLPPEVKKALLNMKAGESKSITLTGSTKGDPMEFDYTSIAPIHYAIIPEKYLQDTYEESMDVSDLEEQYFKCSYDVCGYFPRAATNVKVGSTISMSNPAGWGVSGTVLSKQGSQVTVRIKNIGSPFYKKKLGVGARGEDARFHYEIIEYGNGKYALAAEWKQSPFYKKSFGVGAVGKIQGMYVMVTGIDEDTGKVQTRLSDKSPETIVYTIKIIKIIQ